MRKMYVAYNRMSGGDDKPCNKIDDSAFVATNQTGNYTQTRAGGFAVIEVEQECDAHHAVKK
jgi:hypothetical protein